MSCLVYGSSMSRKMPILIGSADFSACSAKIPFFTLQSSPLVPITENFCVLCIRTWLLLFVWLIAISETSVCCRTEVWASSLFIVLCAKASFISNFVLLWWSILRHACQQPLESRLSCKFPHRPTSSQERIFHRIFLVARTRTRTRGQVLFRTERNRTGRFAGATEI